MSISPSYFCFGCVEIGHNARTLAYHRWACRTGRYENSSCIPKLETWLCYCDQDGSPDSFTDPITDGACWYDPLIPESADFLGVIVQRVSGLRTSTFSREVLEGIAGGSILSQPKRLGKQLVYEVFLLSTSCAGMDYGEQWLRRQLEEESRCPKDGTTCASCQGQAMTLRVHCSDPTTTYDSGLHLFTSAGTIDGVSLVEDDFPLGPQCCCQFRRATFTIQTEDANSYSPTPITSCTISSDGNYVFGRIGSCSDDVPVEEQCCPFCSASCNPCTSDPQCDCIAPYVLEPETIGETAPCFSDPLCRCIGAACVSDIPSGYFSAFRLNIFAGFDPANDSFTDDGLRNVVIRIFETDGTFACPSDETSYEALIENVTPCAELGVSWIPQSSTLTIDGLSGKSWLSCQGQCYDHSERVFAMSGDVFPLLARCQDLVFVVEWDCLNTQQNNVGVAIPSSVEVQTFVGFNL